jgi:hypothetical protein
LEKPREYSLCKKVRKDRCATSMHTSFFFELAFA